VISIGNLTLGGTGKTPLVRWTARRLTQQGRRVAILSRGYGSTGDAPNDEALELARTLPDVPHLQDPDRVASAQTAVCGRGCEVILLDDGFQHRRLARDMDVVLLDALAPFGFGHVFPRGLLREPLEGLSRADVVVLSRADLLSAENREVIRRQVLPLAEVAVWCEVSHAPQGLVNATGERQPIAHLARQRLAAFCGIGNPEGFRRTLADQDLEVASWREFPDHHAFGPADVTALVDWSRESPAAAVVCTLKDLVKLEVDQLGDLPLWAVEIEIGFLAGRDEMEEAVTRAASKGA
jgi:tetraacyldisaccharide 4'-kinase